VTDKFAFGRFSPPRTVHASDCPVSNFQSKLNQSLQVGALFRSRLVEADEGACLSPELGILTIKFERHVILVQFISLFVCLSHLEPSSGLFWTCLVALTIQPDLILVTSAESDHNLTVGAYNKK